jgi:crotonobetainyl-CoA:carnitine CoA-transferase CaiB-like acyl-CoA transferase
MLQEVTHPEAGTIPIANTPFRMSRSESGIKGPPPNFGQHTRDVLGELLGMGDAEVEKLEQAGVVLTKGGPDLDAIT